MMAEIIVPPFKVNLAEMDIEEWLYQNPGSIHTSWGKLTKWIARQYIIPSGRIDLLGMMEHETFSHLVVVEVKNTEFTTDALCQVVRYAGDIKDIQCSLTDWQNEFVQKILIAKGQPSNEIQFAADAMDVDLYSFDVHYSLAISGAWGWQQETRETHRKTKEELSHDKIFSFLKPQSEVEPTDKPE
jgi:hypothetical protein